MKKRFHSSFIIIVFVFLASGTLLGQERTVRGSVLSMEDDSPIVGASVMIPHSTIGTATDADGHFMLRDVPAEKRSIAVSAIGFRTVTVDRDSFQSGGSIIRLVPVPVQTHTIVVTANKRPQSLEEIPVSISIVNSEQLQQRNITAVDDALRYVPGVNFQQTQINIRASSGYSRGVGSRVMMLVDGIPLLSGDTGEITFESIPVAQIERIEVVKGAGSALYGSGALGGVVNVLTKQASETPAVWWKMYGGMYDEPAFAEWKWSDVPRWINGQRVGFSTTAEAVGITASVQRHSDDGYREQDWIRKYGAYLKLKYILSPSQSFTYSANLFQQYRGDFLWWKDLKNALRPADAQRNIMVSSLRFNNSATFTHYVNDRFYYEAKAVHFRGNWYRDSLKNTRMDGSISDAFVADVQGTYTFDDRNIFTFGAVGNAERVRANIFGRHDGRGGAIYLQHEHLLDQQFSAIAGARFDRQQVVGLPAQSMVSPKFGMRYSAGEGSTLRLSAGRGFRAPSIGELYTSTANTGSAAIVVPSIGLAPERSWTYELSGSFDVQPNIHLEAALFHSDFDGLIEPNVEADVSRNAVTVNFKNITQARIQGWELGLVTQHFDGALSLEGHYNYNWAIDIHSKKFLRFRPRHIAGINSIVRWESFGAGADYRFVSRIEEIDDKLVDLAPIKNGSQRTPIHVVDLRFHLDERVLPLPARLTLNVNNIFGYRYAELIGNMSPPRHLVLSVEGAIL